MEWHKVEDYPIESGEYVLVSTNCALAGCVVAKLFNGYWEDGFGMHFSVLPTDHWCHIDLPKD